MITALSYEIDLINCKAKNYHFLNVCALPNIIGKRAFTPKIHGKKFISRQIFMNASVNSTH